MKVVCFSGQRFYGKDLAADYLASRLGWGRSSFAAAVKKVFCDTFCVDLEFVEKWKPVKEPPPGFDLNVRESLQFIGDGFRKIKGTIWVDLAFKDTSRPVILSDGRYINELKKVRDVGGANILLYRPGYINDDPNGSESQIRPLVEWFVEQGYDGVFDSAHFTSVPEPVKLVDVFLRNDGTPQEFCEKIDNIVIPYIASKYAIHQ